MTIARYYVQRTASGSSSLVFTYSTAWISVAVRGQTPSGSKLDPISLAINTTSHTATLTSSGKDYAYEIVFSTDNITNAMIEPGGVLYPYGQDDCPSRTISITPNAGFLVDGDPPPPPPEVGFCVPAKPLC